MVATMGRVLAQACIHGFNVGKRQGRIQLAYGLAARIPVAIVMLIAIYANWGTHYDVAPPTGLPDVGPFLKWVIIGLLPQMTTWIAFTILVGALFGAIIAAFAGPKKAKA